MLRATLANHASKKFFSTKVAEMSLLCQICSVFKMLHSYMVQWGKVTGGVSVLLLFDNI